MFDIRLKFENIEILSIEKEDLESIYKWYVKEENFLYKRQQETMNKNQFYERFLEYYLSECEFFLKIIRNKQLIGIIKGRIEFKNPNEVWLGYMILDHSLRGKGLGGKVLKEIIKYFCVECGICNFYAKVKEKDFSFISFLRKIKFRVLKFSQESGKNTENKFWVLARIIQ
ncbi:GNAT family N-acetyltransferase [Clostridium sp. ZS2-4]|uniref:GNAT family N-acetyltransferase n=1 Tax=Clostridium sp. ZS2-4 TaxID=2987703 RepID=UPI00227A9320|nr:GNAT family N-acetyltransferase [Clostridium sp. ZS2-4]MCY6354950.1 GNAT family N-acetyltransferase [Clostridium sp. ZS2-4]